MKTFRFLPIAAAMLWAPGLSGKPVMEGEVLQNDCNGKGYFYDHRSQRCTDQALVECASESLEALLEGKAGAAERFRAIHRDFVAQGYQLSQCYVDDQQDITVSYVQKNLWLTVKTVKLK